MVVHLYNSPEQNDEPSIKENLESLSKIFPMLKVELVTREGQFGPKIINAISREFGVAKNNIFVGAPEDKHRFSVQQLGGVRVIF